MDVPSNSTSDAELLRLGGQGNQAAQRELVDRHARYLFGVAHALTRNSADAEDVVQEAFLGAFKTQFRGESSLRTWLVRILMRRAGMLRRSRFRESRDVPLEAMSQDLAAAETSAPREGAGADARLDLATMLEALSPEHRQVIILRELQQMSYEQMAQTLSVPRGTIESRLHRAREELRKKFAGYL
jgi:RNA polymerase sigma-70 factor (ECF subfamily)